MPRPSYCPNAACSNHVPPRGRWLTKFGFYRCAAHGRVQRYKCRNCGATISDQTESLHYFAKRRLPLKAIKTSLLEGASMREVGRRYKASPMAVQQAVIRLGRQSIAAQSHLLDRLHERNGLVIDGFRSFVTSQDYPCDITITVDRDGETVLTMTHALFRRGGRTTAQQKHRLHRKNLRWQPLPGSMKQAISLQIKELWDYARPRDGGAILVDTDEHPLYLHLLALDRLASHFRLAGLFSHRQTSSRVHRSMQNPLFPANYVDRLIRHRLREHTRETIAFGRNAVMQMHRAWIFAWDHNANREFRVRNPLLGVHAVQGSVRPDMVSSLTRSFYRRRIRPSSTGLSESLKNVWEGSLQTPPVRWRAGQSGSSVFTPAFILREIRG